MSTTHASGAKNQLTLRQKSVGGGSSSSDFVFIGITRSSEAPGTRVLGYFSSWALPLNGSTAKNALIPGNFQYLLRIVWYDRYKKI